MDYTSFYSISYGLYIVTSKFQDKPCGYVANTVFQVTSEPPRIAVSCHRDNLSFMAISESLAFNISALIQDASQELIQRFGYRSGRDTEKFIGTMWKNGSNGLPIVFEDCLAYFECRVVASHDVGTHMIFIGEVDSAEWINPNLKPLTYALYRETKHAYSPKNSPTYIDPSLGRKKEEAVKTAGKRYLCPACGFVYDPELGDEDAGIAPGTLFENLPDDWICPVCGVEKSGFIPME